MDIIRAGPGLVKSGSSIALQTTPQSLPFSSSIDWNASSGTNVNILCTSNTNFTLNFPSGLIAGMQGIITVTQFTTGGQVITWPSGYRGGSGTMPVLSTANSAVDELVWYTPDGVNVDLILHTNFVSGVTQNGQLDFSTGNNSDYIVTVV